MSRWILQKITTPSPPSILQAILNQDLEGFLVTRKWLATWVPLGSKTHDKNQWPCSMKRGSLIGSSRARVWWSLTLSSTRRMSTALLVLIRIHRTVHRKTQISITEHCWRINSSETPSLTQTLIAWVRETSGATTWCKTSLQPRTLWTSLEMEHVQLNHPKGKRRS